jgi:hypothetical protein
MLLHTRQTFLRLSAAAKICGKCRRKERETALNEKKNMYTYMKTQV